MQDVRELLRRRQAGQSARRIARETGLDRKTVGRYLEQAAVDGVTAEVAVTDDVASAVGRGVQARPVPAPSEPWLALGGRRAQIQAWLDGDPPLRLGEGHVPISGHAGALIALAPEMEALLRKHEFAVSGRDVCIECHSVGTLHRDRCSLAALLARLDAARKADG